MGRLSCHVRGARAVVALALLATTLGAPAAALADRDGRGGASFSDFHNNRDGDRGGDRGDDHGDDRGQSPHCPGRETLVSLDQKICPPNKNRPLIVRKRACCKNPAGRVHCDHFDHCPNESPS